MKATAIANHLDLAEFKVSILLDHLKYYADKYESKVCGLIPHDVFREWVEDNGYLNQEQVSYVLCDVVQWKISYTDLIQCDDIEEIVFKYLSENNLI